MTLFNYGECDVCKTIKGSKEKVLMDIIPVDISCKVRNYICCWRCEKMKENINTMTNILPLILT